MTNNTMKTMQNFLFVILTGFFFLVQNLAWAENCPDDLHAIDAIENAILQATTCKKAYQIMQVCGTGASPDASFGAAVLSNCEPHFVHKLSTQVMQRYKKELQVCGNKYAKQSGTMYISFSAFCTAAVAVKYHDLYFHKKTPPSQK